ncbi:hypothetical protein [Calothrix sp. NIES-3974]|uniref:hypothetical protein n=1 Tax=Calothrix sp. NIES-3974 TaxID=2005462 RepID=UPI000B602953|nr:hypothetical protein [Calothrix sp. NIES-3974]BAZ05266.1 hypothetical protein NIES3974_19120 [Calothrix sp. NIES-3974]
MRIQPIILCTTLCATSLAVSILAGRSFADTNTHPPHHQSTPRGNRKHHHHEQITIPPGQPVPTIKLSVTPDAKKGWNLQAQVTNFRFAPESVNTNPRLGEGHAHIYINDRKLTRLYSSWYYIEQLPPGKNRIKVTLNANNHADFVHNGKAIADTVIVEVK